jgi:hypothetical protein
MINWPDELINDIARRRCVIVLGSGTSAQSVSKHGTTPKSWSDFLDSASKGTPVQSVVASLISTKDYLMACEIIKKAVGRQSFCTLLRKEYQTPGFKASKIHELIYRLDSRIILTPNFDKIYETFATHESSATIAVKQYYDDDLTFFIKPPSRAIIKIHGTVDRPEEVIFSKSDYIKARTKHRLFYHMLEALIMTHSFLFLGCGLNDPDIQLVLEDYACGFWLTMKHYFTLPDGSMKQEELDIYSQNMNLNFLTYNPVNNHQMLVDSLEELVNKADISRNELARTMDW